MNRDSNIILASSSPYRRELLQRLGIGFSSISPDIDETPRAGETPHTLVQRLALAKAVKVAETEPDAIIIGSDQVAALNGKILAKPGNRDNALRQLQTMRGHKVIFLTGLCVLDAHGRKLTDCIACEVGFRDLSDAEIGRYLDNEAPYDCAGAFKSEGLGIALTEKISGDDPTALIGLPLIRLAAMLREFGLALP